MDLAIASGSIPMVEFLAQDAPKSKWHSYYDPSSNRRFALTMYDLIFDNVVICIYLPCLLVLSICHRRNSNPKIAFQIQSMDMADYLVGKGILGEPFIKYFVSVRTPQHSTIDTDVGIRHVTPQCWHSIGLLIAKILGLKPLSFVRLLRIRHQSLSNGCSLAVDPIPSICI